MTSLNYTLSPSVEKYYGSSLRGATEDSAGLDLRIANDVVLFPNQTELIPTGISVAIPQSYFGLVSLRSSLGKRGLRLANSVGIIDSDYRGEILLALHNITDLPMSFKTGERVAQLVVISHLPVDYTQVQTLDDTDRGSGGFGSTGNG